MGLCTIQTSLSHDLYRPYLKGLMHNEYKYEYSINNPGSIARSLHVGRSTGIPWQRSHMEVRRGLNVTYLAMDGTSTAF